MRTCLEQCQVLGPSIKDKSGLFADSPEKGKGKVKV